MFDFPNSPTVGQIVTTNGITRQWDGTAWSIIATTIQGVTGTQGLQGVQGTQGLQGIEGQISADPTVTILLFGGM